MYCEIARLFGKWPHEVAALPVHLYTMYRKFVLDMHDGTPAGGSSVNDPLAAAAWDSEVVTSLVPD